MYVGLFILMIAILLLNSGKSNKCYWGLVLLQAMSFLLQFLVGRGCTYDSFKTFFNLLFVNVNILLLLLPWKYIHINEVRKDIELKRYLQNIKKFLYPILFISVFINILVFIVVVIFIPDIAQFKAAGGYKDLYDQIPYFGILFRFSSATTSFGYLAVPLFFYYLSINEKKQAYKTLFLSSSTLLAGIALYSRAAILSYFLTFIFFFFVVEDALTVFWKNRLTSFLKKVGLIIVGGFLAITVIRFSAMEYYGDRIPPNSIIKDPVTYSLFDYASQGYPNGIDCLERYRPEYCLNGEDFFYSVYQALSFFGLMSWDSDGLEERVEKAFSGNYGLFNGYVATNVCSFGYLFTFIMDVGIFILLTNYFKRKKTISLMSLNYVLIFLNVAVNSIFYNSLASFIFPIIFLWLISLKIHLKA